MDQDGKPIVREDGSYLHEPVRNAEGQPVKDANGDVTPKLDYIEIEHTGSTPEQNFSVDLVATALLEGWMSIKDGKLMLHGKTKDLKPLELVYTIKRTPGKHSIPKNKPTDPGYEVLHCYECVLDAAQHETYQAKTWLQRKEDIYLAMGLTPRRKEVARG
jgi:hypothetical protein